jgi:hypothetical protein
VTVDASHSQAKLIATSGLSVAAYLYQEQPVVITARSPSTSALSQSSEKGLSFETQTGRRTLSATEYATGLRSMRPSAAAALADEVCVRVVRARVRDV